MGTVRESAIKAMDGSRIWDPTWDSRTIQRPGCGALSGTVLVHGHGKNMSL